MRYIDIVTSFTNYLSYSNRLAVIAYTLRKTRSWLQVKSNYVHDKKGLGMQHVDPLTIVQAWQEAANAQNADRLLELSDPNIEVVGPRGSGFGHQLLRDWIARAGLTLKMLRAFVRGDTVVVEQHGVWHSLDTGEVIGEKTLASVFQVNDQHVVRFARHDSLNAAFEAVGLDQSME